MIKLIKDSLNGWFGSFCLALVIVFIVKTFIGMPTTVKGTSMATTLYPEDKLFLSTWSVNFSGMPKRGDIVTFEAPTVDTLVGSSDHIAIYTKDSRSFGEKVLYFSLGISNSSYIKRVIGLPGDHVEIKNNCVYINGVKFKEKYISSAMITDMSLGGECDDVIVPDGCVYVLGDNRVASVDSRRFGCIPVCKIEGKVIARWWPLQNRGTM